MSGWLQCSFLSSGLREKSLKVGAYTYRVLAFRVIGRAHCGSF